MVERRSSRTGPCRYSSGGEEEPNPSWSDQLAIKDQRHAKKTQDASIVMEEKGLL